MTPEIFATQTLCSRDQFEAWRAWYNPVFEVIPKSPLGDGFAAQIWPQKTFSLVSTAAVADTTAVITSVLSLIDISLVASLVLMVMLACYENFTSGFEIAHHKFKPSWMGHTDFGELKLKLLTSIVAISAIHVLESFMNVHSATDHELAWSVGILIAFVVCAMLLAVMNRVSPSDHQ